MVEPLRYTAVFEDTGEGWIYARVLEIPGVHTQGRTIEEARTMVHDALRLVLEYRRDHGELDLPDDAALVEPVEITL
jgi:predicted RNase H-like HicB family nuclease